MVPSYEMRAVHGPLRDSEAPRLLNAEKGGYEISSIGRMPGSTMY